MTREERDKIDSRNNWPSLPDAKLRELRDWKESHVKELIVEEESLPEHGEFALCCAIHLLQRDIALINEMLTARIYEI